MVKEYGLDDLSPNSMMNFAERMYNDTNLASLYQWNKSRRNGKEPVAKLHDQQYLCMLTSESFEENECNGKPDIDMKSTTGLFDYIISNWIDIKN